MQTVAARNSTVNSGTKKELNLFPRLLVWEIHQFGKHQRLNPTEKGARQRYDVRNVYILLHGFSRHFIPAESENDQTNVLVQKIFKAQSFLVSIKKARNSRQTFIFGGFGVISLPSICSFGVSIMSSLRPARTTSFPSQRQIPPPPHLPWRRTARPTGDRSPLP